MPHHMGAAYHRSLLAAILAQLDSEQRFDGGAAGLLSLIRSVPVIRSALRQHAAERDISLRERLSEAGAALGASIGLDSIGSAGSARSLGATIPREGSAPASPQLAGDATSARQQDCNVTRTDHDAQHTPGSTERHRNADDIGAAAARMEEGQPGATLHQSTGNAHATQRTAEGPRWGRSGVMPALVRARPV